MTEPATRLGILGGSFNPVHVGHLRIAQFALDALQLDRVLLVPAGRPPHKDPRELAAVEHRLAMLRLAVADAPRLEVSEVEVHRPGVCYTIDTIDALRAQVGEGCELFFLIGADTIAELPTWHRVRDLAARCRIVPFARAEVGISEARARLAKSVGDEAADAICDRLVRMEPVAVSSTDIRTRVAAGRSIRGLVPDAVAAYIAAEGLYRR